MEEEILAALRRQAALGHDQGLTVAEIAQEIGADQDDVPSVLEAMKAKGSAHKESFWWYPGPAPDRGAPDQA
jgi:hypothetical protein